MEENQKSNAGKTTLKVVKVILKVIYIVISIALAAAGIIAVWALVKTGLSIYENLESFFMMLR